MELKCKYVSACQLQLSFSLCRTRSRTVVWKELFSRVGICNQGQTKPSPCCFSARIVVSSVAKGHKSKKNLFFYPESDLENFS